MLLWYVCRSLVRTCCLSTRASSTKQTTQNTMEKCLWQAACTRPPCLESDSPRDVTAAGQLAVVGAVAVRCTAHIRIGTWMRSNAVHKADAVQAFVDVHMLIRQCHIVKEKAGDQSHHVDAMPRIHAATSMTAWGGLKQGAHGRAGRTAAPAGPAPRSWTPL